MSTRRMALSTLGTVSTRLGGSTGSMSRDLNAEILRSVKRTELKLGNRVASRDALAEHPGQAQGGKRVIGQRVVVDHVCPRRRRPGQLGQIQSRLLFEDVCGFERLLSRL